MTVSSLLCWLRDSSRKIANTNSFDDRDPFVYEARAPQRRNHHVPRQKIFDKKEFSEMIENLAVEKDCSYMDAIVDYCTRNEMEIDVAAKLLNPKIKKSIEAEASGLNMLKYKRGKLDF